ncbi:hypothetical protein ACHAXT_006935 [Thalassiosira profunda]
MAPVDQQGQREGGHTRPDKRGGGGGGGGKKKARGKKAPFFPSSPSSVGSPIDDGRRFRPRRVRRRTPRHLCTLALPPPLLSLFDGSGATVEGAPRLPPSDASLDGLLEGGASHLHAPAPVRHSSNASVVSASVASAGGTGSGGGGSTVHSRPRLPPHLRAGLANCDPLLACGGRYVLVATGDGRIAVYSIVEFDAGISEDVAASERRRRAEWREEDETDGMMAGESSEKEEEKKDEPKGQPDGQQRSPGDAALEELIDLEEGEDSSDEEDNEWEMRDQMHRRENAKQAVAPLLVVALPHNNPGLDDDAIKVNTNVSYDEESTSGHFHAPHTIVAMCATPGNGTSLIEQRCVASASSGALSDEPIAEETSERVVSGSQLALPTFGKDLLGHVAVLTDVGEVFILDVLANSSASRDEGSGHAPSINVVVSFRTGHLSATCICMNPVPASGDGSNSQQMQLSVGHQSGIVIAFQIYSRCIYRKVAMSPEKAALVASEVPSASDEDTAIGPPAATTPRRPSSERRTPLKSPSNHMRSKSDVDSLALSDALASPGKAAPPRVLFRGTGSGTAANGEHLGGRISFHRTLSEPIATSDGCEGGVAPMVGPAKVVLCWKGKFDVPVRSISCTGWANSDEGEAATNAALLAVGLEQRQRDRASQDAMHAMAPSVPHFSLSPAISLEVINVTLAEEQWRKKGGGEADEYASLYDCGVWPAAGKEIKDGWMRGSPMRRGIDPRDKLYQILGVQRTSVTNKICCFEGSRPCFASASSDGTVAISHCSPEDGSWGVMQANNQLMFFERCIGLAAVDGGGRYVACCLRGGTIYLVPVVEPGTATTDQNEIAMLSVPVDPDGEDDGLERFVQNFTAGTALVGNWKDPLSRERYRASDKVSARVVAMVGWPGGNIDVYAIN